MPMHDMATQHAKQLVAMRAWLQGRSFFLALDALEYAKSFYSGTRKDGYTPSFYHPLFIANMARCLSVPNERQNGIDPIELLITIAFLHDVVEDYFVGLDEIEARFGPLVALAVRRLSKKIRNDVIPYDQYFSSLAQDPLAALIKGLDRCHNILTMHAASWSCEKMQAYLNEVFTYFLPMLHTTRRNFPRYEPAFEMVKSMLLMQAGHIQHMLDLLSSPSEASSSAAS